MTFPLAEVKVAAIRRETAEPRTTVVIRLYRVDDGGVVNGQQQYVRTLWRQRVVKRVGVLASDAAILTALRNNVMGWLANLGVNLPQGRVICTL